MPCRKKSISVTSALFGMVTVVTFFGVGSGGFKAAASFGSASVASSVPSVAHQFRPHHHHAIEEMRSRIPLAAKAERIAQSEAEKKKSDYMKEMKKDIDRQEGLQRQIKESYERLKASDACKKRCGEGLKVCYNGNYKFFRGDHYTGTPAEWRADCDERLGKKCERAC